MDDLGKKEPSPPKPEQPPARTPSGAAKVSLELKEEKLFLTAGMSRKFPIVVKNDGTEDDTVRVKIDMLYNYEVPDPPEWTVKLYDIEVRDWERFSQTALETKVWLTSTFVRHHMEVSGHKDQVERNIKELTEKGQPVPESLTKEMEQLVEKLKEAEESLSKPFLLISGGQKELTLLITCPKGARHGDRLNVVVNASSKSDPTASDHKTLAFTARQCVLAVKTSIGHEKAVADSLYSRAKAKDIGVFSILAPANLRGYLFIETMNPDRLEEVIRGIRRARGIAGDRRDKRGRRITEGEDERTIQLDQIEIYLAPKPIVSGIMEGDIVELISGPFKGEKARVQRIDEAKEEITVELFEAMVPIPVTVRGDAVRVLQKEKEET